MADIIRIQLSDGNYYYLNLDNVINIFFKDEDKTVIIDNISGSNTIKNNEKEGYDTLKNKINEAMEKRFSNNNNIY